MSRHINIITVRAKDVKVGDVVLHPARPGGRSNDQWREITKVEVVNTAIVLSNANTLARTFLPYTLLKVQEAK